MAKKLMDGEVAALVNFPYWYTNVLAHSRFDDMTYEEFQGVPGTGRMISEFLAAAGKDHLSFALLRDVVAITDRYIRDGAYDETAMKALEPKLAAQSHDLVQVLIDFLDSDKVDRNTFDGAPIVLFVFSYAEELFKVCRIVNKIDDPQVQADMRAQLWKNRRIDPDEDPDPEKIPEFT